MTCKGCLECLLKLLNFLLTLTGLAIIGYGIYLFVEWNKVSDVEVTTPADHEVMSLGRPMLLAVSLSTSILDKLSKAWFIYLFIAIGVILFVISCFGCIGVVTRSICCLTCYSVLLILSILVEVGCAAFIFLDHSWTDAIPDDKTGDFDMIYEFLRKNWKIVKWVALGAVILQALALLLALIVRAANRPAAYDSDDEYIAPSSNISQPLLNRHSASVTGVPVSGALDHRPSRNDTWSTRMREKYGFNASDFTYKPTEANRFQQAAAAAPAEEKVCCSIM